MRADGIGGAREAEQGGRDARELWIALGALAGLTAVAMAALAAHGLDWLDPARAGHGAQRARRCRAGTRWRCWPAVYGRRAAAAWRDCAGAAFALGLVLFCGAVYALALGGVSLGMLAPTRRHAADAGLGAARAVGAARAMTRAACLAAEGYEGPLAEELARLGITVGVAQAAVAALLVSEAKQCPSLAGDCFASLAMTGRLPLSPAAPRAPPVGECVGLGGHPYTAPAACNPAISVSA